MKPAQTRLDLQSVSSQATKARATAMQDKITCTIAQLLFHTPPDVSFSDLIDDVQVVLRAGPAKDLDLTWDDGDTALLDIAGSRIAVSLRTNLSGDHSACLTIGVGFGPGQGTTALALRQGTVSRLLADRLQSRLRPDDIIWQQPAGDLTGDALDRLLADLPGIVPAMLPLEQPGSALAPAAMPAAKPAAKPAVSTPASQIVTQPRIALVANQKPTVLHPQIQDLRRIRAALHAPQPRHGTAMRLAAHAMNATLIMIAMPAAAATLGLGMLQFDNLNAHDRLYAIIGRAAVTQPSFMAPVTRPLTTPGA